MTEGGSEGEPTLRRGTLSLAQNIIIGLDSTAPAYSLAAVIGIIAVGVGFQTPAVLVLAFLPMICVAFGYRALNRVDPNCGTSYVWVARAFGPRLGWATGLLVVITGVVVVGSLADVAATYTFDLIGWEVSAPAIVGLATLFVVLMTAVTVIGIELSARVQAVLAAVQMFGLALFAVAAFSQGQISPSLGWFNPFAIPLEALPAALIVAVFIYWGWESTTSVNEETENPHAAPGVAAVVSTVLLLVTYISVTVAVFSLLGSRTKEYEDDVALFSTAAEGILPGGLAWIVLLSVIVSALATTHTTILPGSRTAYSMARERAFPSAFARIHPRTRTPAWATVYLSLISLAWYVPSRLLDEDFLANTITGLGLLIAFYYGVTALAAPFLVRPSGRRRTLTDGVLPVLGGAGMFGIFALALKEFLAEGVPFFTGLTLIAAALLLARAVPQLSLRG